MKKVVAMLLVGVLAVQSWMGVPVYGAQNASMAGTESSVTGEEPTVTEPEPTLTDPVPAQGQGILEVEVGSSQLMPYHGSVTVGLYKGENEVSSKDLTYDGTSSFQTARFFAEEGDYAVAVRSEKFADYAQEVKIEKGWTTKVMVCSSRVEAGGSAQPGWFRPGDVNSDGTVDQTDISSVLQAVRSDAPDLAADVNGDGKLDMVDLQHTVQSVEAERLSAASKLGIVQSVQSVDGTVMEGGQGFLNQEGTVTLKPQDQGAAISKSNPVAMDFVLAAEGENSVPLQGMAIQAPIEEDGALQSGITDGEAVISYIDENGEEKSESIPFSNQSFVKAQPTMSGRAKAASLSRAASVGVEADGSLILDFGTQIAVKRVTIKITGTKKTEPLVNIAKVEFVNDMENRISAPELNIPKLSPIESADKSLTASWSAQSNVTGYEVSVTGPVKDSDGLQTQVVRVAGTQHMIGSLNDGKMMNFEEYKVKVRSVNGDWCSPWSEELIGIPKPTKLPAPPDFVKTAGRYRSIDVSWKDMDDSAGYMVYYKKKSEPETSYRPVVEGFTPVKEGTGRIDATSYTIRGLEDEVEYSVYVIGWNELGWGGRSIVSLAKTKTLSPPMLPKYKLINTSNGTGKLTAHIVSASHGSHNGAKMVGSALDVEKYSALGVVDDDYASYWVKEDWDDGVAYPANGKGLTIALDNDYQMNFITYAAADQVQAMQYVRVDYYQSQNPSEKRTVGARLYEKRDENENPFYIVKLNESITANKVTLSFGRDSSRQPMMVGEVHFHYYDSLEDDIMGLYQDEMHTTLRADVTKETIDGLAARLETVDEASGEKHPLYRELMLEIETATEILNSALEPSYEVDPHITGKKDGHLGFGGLNAWQPLGRVAYSGESLLVYVGHNTKRTGDNASLQLVFTQHHSEAAGFAKAVGLKVGRNEITVPKISTSDFERGGQIYVAYTGNNASDQYAVRVSGGSRIPALSVYGKTEAERMDAIRAYVEDLEAYVGTIEAGHEQSHKGTVGVDYDYDQTNCILNATDIMMKEMMYSLPATQVWAGLKGAEDKAVKLDAALKAMEQTMTLFYHHKGLSDEAGEARGNNALPSQHLNIRYMRMFAGAFMYAAGNHIGIEWGSAPLASAPNDMSGFGWGIGHEIGHDINQGTYAVAEVTNNYFAMLLTGTQRFTYENVYKKVTSGSVGRASNVFTQLALYWQLHLAFDNQSDDHHVYDNYEDQFANLFFARMDTYSRNPAKAPQEGLTFGGGSDQNLMRLACASAEKNILPFFERWGMRPDEDTIAYASKYGEADTKALYYANEDAREYRLAHLDEAGSIKEKDAIRSANVTASSNRAEITIATNESQDLILGYEISRSMISNGEKKTEVIGFVPIDTADSTVYVDTVTTINNRVLEYEVRAVDKFLNYSNVKSAGSVKIQTDGVLNKSEWTVETDLTSEDDTELEPDAEDPDSGFDATNPGNVEGKKVNSIERILDNDLTAEGTYAGTCEGTGAITIDMHKVEQVTSLKYQGDALGSVTVEVSQDQEAWVTVKENYTGLSKAGTSIIWFDAVEEGERDSWIGTYDARYVRITLAHTGAVSIQEIDVCGPSGDNLEFMTAEDGQPAVGILSADYKYGDEAEDVIPEGSLIFTGTYKGNPAYNVVVLYDTEGNVIGEKDGNVLAKQVIFADVPENGNLGETSDGTWVYYVEPGQWDADSLKKIGGVRGELYRVDNALTLAGERVVSDTKVIAIPDSLTSITMQGGKYEKVD